MRIERLSVFGTLIVAAAGGIAVTTMAAEPGPDQALSTVGISPSLEEKLRSLYGIDEEGVLRRDVAERV